MNITGREQEGKENVLYVFRGRGFVLCKSSILIFHCGKAIESG